MHFHFYYNRLTGFIKMNFQGLKMSYSNELKSADVL